MREESVDNLIQKNLLKIEEGRDKNGEKLLYIEKNSIDQFDEQRRGWISLAEVSRLLNIHDYQIKELVAEKLLKEIKDSYMYPKHKSVFNKADAEKIYQAFETAFSHNRRKNQSFQVINLGRATANLKRIGKDFGKFVQYVIDGKIVPSRKAEGAGLSKFYFSASEIKQLYKTILNEIDAKTLTLQETAIFLRTNTINIQSLIKAGFLQIEESKKLNWFGMRIKIESIESLLAKYILSVNLMRKHHAKIQTLLRFSFLRVLREMPTLRQFRPTMRSVGNSLAIPHDLPTGEPIDSSIRVAVFDGGLPESPDLGQWVRYKEQQPLEASVPNFENHGLAVTSALLFGSLQHGKPLEKPFSYVDHYRVLDTETGNDPQGELLDVLKRIRDILQNQKYHFVNLSIGPDLPIEDDEVSAWTAVLDPLFSDGQTLPTIAVGNSGDLNWELGNARIQTPSDCVNGFSIGSCDQQENSWKRASYSSIGPGRSPGLIKPDALAFGGTKTNPFWVLDRGTSINSIPTTGTSFAAPNALRTAIGIRALLGNSITPLAIKALMLNRCEKNGYGSHEAGRGRIISSLEKLITCEESTAHIVYQGQLSPAQWIRAKIPLPAIELAGSVEISATICFATQIDSQDTVNYTRSGLEIYFRPHSKKFGKNTANPKAQPFFKSFGNGSEINSRKDAHKWETTLSASKKLRGINLDEPVLDIHYNARTSGGPAYNPENISYALVISVRAPQNPDLYDRIVQRYRTSLEVLRPAIEIPIHT